MCIFAVILIKTNNMTPFEEKVQQTKLGMLKLPYVNYQGKQVPYFMYQLAVHRFNLNILASGMKFRNITLTDIKKEYGLKGRSAKDCLPQFEEVMNKYLNDVVGLN